jgi:hypothetical protein
VPIGEIAQYMLKSSTKYAFLVSADEIMCLKFDMIQKVDYNNDTSKDPVDLFVEPWIHYSLPIRWADILHEAKGTVSVKLALLYLLYCSMQEDYELESEIGNAERYRTKTKAGARYMPKLSWKIGERLGQH